MTSKKSSSILVRIGGDAQRLADAVDTGGKLIAGFAAGAGVALSKGFYDSLGAEANDDLIAARLGLTEEDSRRLGDIAANAYRGAWGDSLEDVTDTVTALYSSFESDRLGDSLEDLTGQAEALGAAFELDVGEGVQTAAELVSSGLVDSADEAFDLLTVGLQQMPQGIREELLAASNEYGDFFADLGFSGEEAFGALVEFADDGIFGIDKFGDALKELSIRGSDMSTASVEAYEAAGLSAEGMANRFLEGGDAARGAVEITAAGLLTIADPVEQANAAIALFGTPLEDLSVSEIPAFLEGLIGMGEGLGDVEGAADNMADALGSNASTRIESFRREALGRLADFVEVRALPAFDRMADFVERHLPTAIAVFERRVLPPVQQFAGLATDAFEDVTAWVEQNWPQIEEIVTAVIDRTYATVTTVLDALVLAWELWGDDVVGFVEGAIGPVIEIVTGLVDFLDGVIDFVVGTFTGDWDRAWAGISGIFTGAWDVMTGAVDLAWTAIETAVGIIVSGVEQLWSWSFLSEWVGTAVDAVVVFFEELPGRLGDFIDDALGFGADFGSAVIDGILEGLGAAGGFVTDLAGRLTNALIDGVNSAVVDSINDAIPNSLDFGFLGSIDLPDNPIPRLPKFHDGGPIGRLGGPRREVPIMAEEGEFMLSRDDVSSILRGGGRGPLIGTVNVSDGQGLTRELSRAQALAAVI